MRLGARAGAALFGLAGAGLFAAAAWLVLQPSGHRKFVGVTANGPANLSPFVDEAGQRISIDAYRGKLVVLNLWAAWCAPCIEEMPSLDRLAGRLPESAFAVVAVSQDVGGAKTAKPAFERLNLRRLKLYLDPDRRLGVEIGARGMPTTLILGPDGAPLSYREGAAMWDDEAMIDYLQKLAKRVAPAG